ncbi:hypothetical protein HCN44_005177 [Aphidius gifuensis]|uniref:COMM domain-containing protein n=1 Tax=Aphidius gifuensis TaxID=684658 RepID=A0A834XSV3_APHGI|nr:COMM domain-containing protein 8-like [Aphidius gifuensis]KAF7992833.1 hypothetical protein HCN44_005177 [Aphidius gifuensis]
MDNQNLNNLLSKEDNHYTLTQFLHSCINEICGYKIQKFEQFSSIGWNEEEYNNTRKSINYLFKQPACLYLDIAKMPQTFFYYPENVQELIMTCLKVRQDQLCNALIADISQKKQPTVKDFDWRLKMVMGSSKISSLREFLLQLDLHTNYKNSEDIIGLEMTKEELDLFIKTLESISL